MKYCTRNRLLPFTLWLIAVSLQYSNLAYGQSSGCKHEDSVAGEAQPQPKTWNDLYRSYAQYRRCDDGALGEAYSEFVVYLLTEGWGQLEEVPPLIHAHPNFWKFVLRHVDELMTPDQAKLIEQNATERCPKSALDLCKQLVARLKATSSS
jgi:hypothetical protein